MDWAFIIKGIVYTYLFLACLALYVHFYIRRRGDNWGRLILKVVVTTYVTGIFIGVIGGAVTYVVLMGLN
ncbi:MAG: hypothetical protein VB084_13780 [Syntrophomonadaceae bacterium]|nr:hypothetical protein [Syntrophomonadaceae bacterium]